ncbi:phage tail assembly chaperone [Eubacterium ventriosum]|uniref:phage tail assembly chaperone n=1 Tax=Eubacterium ventriosum TaxID=39496 RepID=UPI003521821C
MDVIDILLSNEPLKAEEKEYKIKRLSKVYKADVIFKLKGLSYNRVADIKNMNNEDVSVHIVLAGVKEPNLKNKELLEKYNAVTPAELVKKMLLPGEIEDISKAIEKLSGYRTNTIEEIKKK